MFQDSLKRMAANAAMGVALIIGLLYLKNTHFDFILSLVHFQKVNLPSFAYTIMRFVYLLLPLLILSPKLFGAKLNRLKLSFIIIGVCYILGSTWIFYFLSEYSLADLSNLELLETYQYLNALVFNYLVWDTYDAWGILFSIVQGTLFILLGVHLSGRRKTVIRLFTATFILSLLFPAFYNYGILSNDGISSLWLTKNTYLLAETLFMLISLYLMSYSRHFWNKTLNS